MKSFNSVKRHRIVYGTRTDLTQLPEKIEKGVLIDTAAGSITAFTGSFDMYGNHTYTYSPVGTTTSELIYSDKAGLEAGAVLEQGVLVDSVAGSITHFEFNYTDGYGNNHYTYTTLGEDVRGLTLPASGMKEGDIFTVINPAPNETITPASYMDASYNQWIGYCHGSHSAELGLPAGTNIGSVSLGNNSDIAYLILAKNNQPASGSVGTEALYLKYKSGSRATLTAKYEGINFRNIINNFFAGPDGLNVLDGRHIEIRIDGYNGSAEQLAAALNLNPTTPFSAEYGFESYTEYKYLSDGTTIGWRDGKHYDQNSNISLNGKSFVNGSGNIGLSDWKSGVDGQANIHRGSNNVIDGDANDVGGESNRVNGHLNFIQGSDNISRGNATKLVGSNNRVHGNYSSAYGHNNAIGENDNDWYMYSHAQGEGLHAAAAYQTIFGKFNTPDAESVLTVAYGFNGEGGPEGRNILNAQRNGQVLAETSNIGDFVSPKALITKEFADAEQVIFTYRVGVSYDPLLHRHDIFLTRADYETLLSGVNVAVETNMVDGHTHLVTFAYDAIAYAINVVSISANTVDMHSAVLVKGAEETELVLPRFDPVKESFESNTSVVTGEDAMYASATGFKAKAESFSERAHGGASVNVLANAAATFDGTIETQRSEFISSAYTVNAVLGRTKEFVHTSLDSNKRYGYCEATVFGQSVFGSNFVDKVIFAIDFADYSVTPISTTEAANTFTVKPTYSIARFTDTEALIDGLVVTFDGVDSEEIMYTVNMDFTIIARAKSIFDVLGIVINNAADGYAKLPDLAEHISTTVQPSKYMYNSEGGWHSSDGLADSLAITREAIVVKLEETESFFTDGVYDIAVTGGSSYEVIAVYTAAGVKVGQMVVLSGYPMSFALKGTDGYYLVCVKQAPNATFSNATASVSINRRNDPITVTEPTFGEIAAVNPAFTQDTNGVNDITMTLEGADVPLSGGTTSGLGRGSYILSYPTAMTNQPVEYSYSVTSTFVIEPYTINVVVEPGLVLSINDHCEDVLSFNTVSTQEDATETAEGNTGFGATVVDNTTFVNQWSNEAGDQWMTYQGWEEATPKILEDQVIALNMTVARDAFGAQVHTTGYKSRLNPGITSSIILAADARKVDTVKDGYMFNDGLPADILSHTFHAETAFGTRHVSYEPVRAIVKEGFTLTSDNPAVIEVQADNTIKALGTGGQSANITATFTHPVTAAVATATTPITIDASAVSVVATAPVMSMMVHHTDGQNEYPSIVITDDSAVETNVYPGPSGIWMGIDVFDYTFDIPNRIRVAQRWVNPANGLVEDGGFVDLNTSVPVPFEDVVVTASLTKRADGGISSLEATLPDATMPFTVHADANGVVTLDQWGNLQNTIWMEPGSVNNDNVQYKFEVNLQGFYEPTFAFVRDGFVLTSSDELAVTINPDNTFNAVGLDNTFSTITATFTHPVTGVVATNTFLVNVGFQPV